MGLSTLPIRPHPGFAVKFVLVDCGAAFSEARREAFRNMATATLDLRPTGRAVAAGAPGNHSGLRPYPATAVARLFLDAIGAVLPAASSAPA
jgi:hypothetical protein